MSHLFANVYYRVQEIQQRIHLYTVEKRGYL